MQTHAPLGTDGNSIKIMAWATELLSTIMNGPFMKFMPDHQTPQVFGEYKRKPDDYFQHEIGKEGVYHDKTYFYLN